MADQDALFRKLWISRTTARRWRIKRGRQCFAILHRKCDLKLMKRMTAIFALLIAPLIACAAPPPRYVEGQVWTYRTRPGDQESLLKIQKVEPTATETIYHISIIGFRLKNPTVAPMIAHTPVSKQSLDASVLIVVADPGTFPPAGPGIAEWRAAAEGSFFTVPVAQIVEMLDETSSSAN